MTQHLEDYFFAVLFVVAAALGIFLFRPYFSALLLAGVLAIVFKPAYRRAVLAFHSENLGAFITTLLVVLIIFTPLAFLGVQLLREATGLYADLAEPGGTSAVGEMLSAAWERYLGPLGVAVPEAGFRDLLRQVLNWFIDNFGYIFASVTELVLMVFLSILGVFYFLRDGDNLRARVMNLLPLSEHYADIIFDRLQRMVNSVIRGSLVVAVIQGIATGVGFWIFGVPNSAFWGMVTVLAALLPTFGTSLVTIPGVIYLWVSGQSGPALGMAIWALAGVGLIDNLLAPQVMKHGTSLHPFLILLAVLGGIAWLGPIGFLAGPLILSFIFALLEIYPSLIARAKGEA